MPQRGGRISATSGGRAFAVDVEIEGLAKTSDEFKRISRSLNAQLREAMVRVGEAAVLPSIKSALPDIWAQTMFVKRDRAGVFIGSRLRGSMNRALGWYDFGGRRPRDSEQRTGPHVIVRELQSKRSVIDNAILRELRRAFHAFETDL